MGRAGAHCSTSYNQTWMKQSLQVLYLIKLLFSSQQPPAPTARRHTHKKGGGGGGGGGEEETNKPDKKRKRRRTSITKTKKKAKRRTRTKTKKITKQQQGNRQATKQHGQTNERKQTTEPIKSTCSLSRCVYRRTFTNKISWTRGTEEKEHGGPNRTESALDFWSCLLKNGIWKSPKQNLECCHFVPSNLYQWGKK